MHHFVKKRLMRKQLTEQVSLFFNFVVHGTVTMKILSNLITSLFILCILLSHASHVDFDD